MSQDAFINICVSDLNPYDEYILNKNMDINLFVELEGFFQNGIQIYVFNFRQDLFFSNEDYEEEGYKTVLPLYARENND